jgi:putative transposase
MLRPTYPRASLCRVLGFPRSTLYDQAPLRDDQEARQAIAAVARQFPTSGPRRSAAQVRRAPYRLLVHRTRAQRVRRSMGLLRPTRPRTQRTPHRRQGFRRCPNLVADRVASAPDERWVRDVTYVRLGTEFISRAMMMDVCTRDIRGGQLGRTLGQELTLTARQRALAHRTPLMHHRDQGVQ